MNKPGGQVFIEKLPKRQPLPKQEILKSELTPKRIIKSDDLKKLNFNKWQGDSIEERLGVKDMAHRLDRVEDILISIVGKLDTLLHREEEDCSLEEATQGMQLGP